MGKVAEPTSQQMRCDGCLKPAAGDLSKHDGDWLCQKCVAILSAAMALLDDGTTAEETIKPTMVFAKVAGGSRGWEELSQTGQLAGRREGLELVEIMHQACRKRPPSLDRDYAGWELDKVLDGVPIVRVRDHVVVPKTHPGTEVLKEVSVQVLSRKVKPNSIGASYERVLAEQGARWDENSQGVFSYGFHGHLGMTVAVSNISLSALDVEGMGGGPLRYPAFHFPSPVFVVRFYEGLLGSLDAAGFAYAMDNYGKREKKAADRIVTAFVAWHVGEGPGAKVPPVSRARVKHFLNKHLLQPLELPELSDERWNVEQALWRDVQRFLWPRFVRLYAGGYATYAND
jgi:hypothetical protein